MAGEHEPVGSAPASWSYRPALDGVRAVAVYLVVLFHSGLSLAGGGFIGVDVFFVLSGFLITNILLSDVDEVGRIRFARFYSRRVRRLLPAAVLTVVVTSLVFLVITNVVRRLPLVSDAKSALLYVANWRFLHEQNDYFATNVAKSPFLHFWSLAIEEQFYVVFPLLLLLLTRLGRRRRWAPATGIGLLFVGSLAMQVYWAGADPSHAYYGTDARVYQLLAGALLAIALRTWPHRPTPAVARTAAAVGLTCVLLLASSLTGAGASSRGIAAMGASTVLLGGLAVHEAGPVHRLLSHRVPVYLGRISYSTYLWHWPVILVIRELVHISPLAVAATAAPIATGLAALSSELLELPVRRSRALDRWRLQTIAAGVAVCVVAAVAVVPPVLNNARRPELVAASVGGTGPRPVVRVVHKGGHGQSRTTTPAHGRRVPKLNWAALESAVGPQHTCTAQDPQQCVVVHGGSPHILLVGDSNARMLAPALIRLAHDHGFTLSLNIMSGCPWQAQETNYARPPSEQAACTAERDVWYRDVLPKLHPDVVILVSYARDDQAIYGQSLRRTGGSNETLDQMLLNTTNETLARITKTGARALILRTILTSSFDPLQCLSQATFVDQCDVPVPLREPISDSFYDSAAAASPEVFTFDINPIMCPGAPACSPMLGGLTVWRNVNHFGVGILVHKRAQIWNSIVASGALSGF
jgi:peptidoglycan/LPS O-acetylase OafA/YrhL